MTMHELYKLLPLPAGELLLDVRTPEEFAEGHLAGARNINHAQVEEHAEELAAFPKVYVYCRSGGRARMAVEWLARHGLKNLVCVGNGGMMDWVAAGYPTER